jgi:hypothetical protein
MAVFIPFKKGRRRRRLTRNTMKIDGSKECASW